LLIVDQGTDYSVALKRAVALANNNQALLTVCAVVDAVPRDLQMAITAVTPLELQKIAISEKQVWLDEVVKSGAVAGVPLESIILVGKPFIKIIRQVLGNGHDLIIKCAEDSGGSGRMLFGSTDMHLMRKCPCPVWITKPTEHHQYRRILAAVDLDPKEAVEREFWLENLVNNYGAKENKDAVDYVNPQLHLIKGTAKAAIPKKARELDVDLIVMGTVARSGIPGFFMGNTAESILNQIDCSVLAIKPPGFESPVTH
jgi:nucleotide-binding universal stress UspA family protein